MSSRRGKRKSNNITAQSATPSLSLRDMMAKDTTSTPILDQRSSTEQMKKISNKAKQNKNNVSTTQILTPSLTKNKRHVNPSNSNLTPYVQIIADEETLHQSFNKSPQQQPARTSASSVSSASFASGSLSKSPAVITSSETLSTKRKRLEEFDDSLAKYLKFNQSILEKVLEEQQKQRVIIETLKDEIFEKHELLQKILSSISSLTTMTEQQQGDKSKQRLKRKDTKNMWWDVPMTKACHRLFQVNKTPLDTDLEQAFKSQIQAHYPNKIRELDDSNATYIYLNLFSCKLDQFAGPEEVRNWKKSEKVIKARHDLWHKMDDDPDSLYTIESILQKVFTEEELKNKDNIKFGVTVTWMFLDPTYDQIEISSSKVQERMNQWDSNPIIQDWLKGKELSEDDQNDQNNDSEVDQESGAKEIIN
ncbi:unnamed protein product [Rhizophagus irregularis]|nr:unnamed protein product [Rhizophagus irregularis]